MTRAWLVAVVLAVAAAPVWAAHLPSFDGTRVYTEASFQAATAPYTRAIAANANDGEAHYWLGVAQLHVARQHRLGVSPFGAGFAGRAAASLERALRLRPAPEVMLALLDAYSLLGQWDKHNALLERVAHLAQPLPIK